MLKWATRLERTARAQRTTQREVVRNSPLLVPGVLRQDHVKILVGLVIILGVIVARAGQIKAIKHYAADRRVGLAQLFRPELGDLTEHLVEKC